jgi:hypothetical protein
MTEPFGAAEGSVVKTAGTAFAVKGLALAVETAFPCAAFTEASVFAKSTGAVTTRATAKFPIIAGSFFAAGAAFITAFADAELAVQSFPYGTRGLVFFAHSFSISCSATDSPSIFKSL